MFGRSLLILVLPLIFIETIAVYIFLDAHWDRVTKTISRNIAGDIATVLALYERDPAQKDFYTTLAGTYLRLRTEFLPQRTSLPPLADSLQGTHLDIALRDQLLQPYTFRSEKRDILVEVQIKNDIIKFSTPLSRFCSKGVILFIAWVALTSAAFLLIAVAFLHNQVKPLRRLAIAADRFGKGRSFPLPKPEGAIEIRKLTLAFTEMRERLRKQLTQRTEMLAGVSHDLRTPLTRMRLQLSMMPPSPEVDGLNKDVEEMNQMLEGYLTFARGEGLEETKETNIKALLLEAISGRADPKVSVHYTPTSLPSVQVKPHALKRCLLNLINNATRYGHHVWITTERGPETFSISVEDDGPGIPKDKRYDVFKPFFRLEASRNIATGGVGLGLTIAHDIAHSQGGEILLSDSPHGGLKATLTLPY